MTEALANTGVGILIAFAANVIIARVYDIPITYEQSGILVFWFTIISLVRTYVIRRAWNSRFWRVWLVRWRYRNTDPDVCCCGSNIGEGGELCYHGGCRSMKEYAITKELDRLRSQ